MADRRAWIEVLGSAFFSPCLDRRQREWIGACADWRAWIGVLGSAFFLPCLDQRQREWIDACGGSACLDWSAWIGVLLAVLGSETERVDRCLWRIGVLGLVLFSSCLDRCSSRRCAPCLDRNFRKFGIERSENVGIESSYREDSRIESREWRERGLEVEREGLR